MWLLVLIAAVIVATIVLSIIGVVRLKRGSLGVTLQEPRGAISPPESPRPQTPAGTTAVDAAARPQTPDGSPAAGGWWTESPSAPDQESTLRVSTAAMRPATEVPRQPVVRPRQPPQAAAALPTVIDSQPTPPQTTPPTTTPPQTPPQAAPQDSLDSPPPPHADEETHQQRLAEPFSWDQSW